MDIVVCPRIARMKTLAHLALALSLAACGSTDSAPGPGGVTVGEARALDEAAAMLDERRLPTKEEAAAADERHVQGDQSGS